VEPEDYARDLADFGQTWTVRHLGAVKGYASNHQTTTSKILRLIVEAFANAKVYVCLSQARLVRRE